MTKHVLISSTYDEARNKIHENGWRTTDYIILTPNPHDMQKLKSLELSPDGYSVLGDPVMPYSFFVTLISRVRATQ